MTSHFRFTSSRTCSYGFRKVTMNKNPVGVSIGSITSRCSGRSKTGPGRRRKSSLGCRKHNGKRFTRLQQNCHIHYGLNPKGENLCKARLEPRRNREMVNGKQHSIWFVPTGMNGLPQNVLLNFRLEFPKSDLTIYLPSGISEIFCQMVST